ncbi:MAG: hypothetical protein K6A44_03100 [bacterium]|nr:hypothetical protein [bacterium]
MSISVVATPFLLLPAFISMAQAAAVAVGVTGAAGVAVNENVGNLVKNEQEYIKMNEEIKRLLAKNDGKVSQEIIDLICREFETVFVDMGVLLKTLEEHGAQNIYVENGNISCEMEGFMLEFYKGEPTQEMAFPPYRMKITTRCDENSLETFIEDINSEYTMNSQEESYNKIKERLDKQNMRIEEEEVYDDNTIVLTVNID